MPEQIRIATSMAVRICSLLRKLHLAATRQTQNPPVAIFLPWREIPLLRYYILLFSRTP